MRVRCVHFSFFPANQPDVSLKITNAHKTGASIPFQRQKQQQQQQRGSYLNTIRYTHILVEQWRF